MVLALLLLLIPVQAPPPCADLSSCRAQADQARDRQDYEAFHDLAWATYRKGRSDDAALMLLVARAQSLSGRPGDALVMLERIVAQGGATDAATSDDFARVRALPRWPDVASRFGATAGSPTAESASTPPGASAAPVVSPAPPAVIPPATVTPTPSIVAPSTKKPSKSKPDPESAAEKAKAEPAKPAPTREAPAPPKDPPAAPKREPGAPLKFTTLLTPSALVYDAVSRRFIIADRTARRIAVIDETTGQVATLVGAQGALGEIGGIAIDSQQGDLWVVTASSGGTVLHRMQLISGRVLSTSPLDGISEPVVAMVFARGTGLVLADAGGTMWKVRAGARSEKIASLEYVPRVLAADPAGRLYVAAGAPRLARLSPGPPLRRIDTVDIPDSVPADAPFVVAGNRLHFIVPTDGSFELRSFPLR